MLVASGSYQDLCETFRWRIPDSYNIGVDICDRWAAAEPDRLAIRDVALDGTWRDHSFADLAAQSNRLANAMRALGLGRTGGIGDRIGVLLPQQVETAITHIAAWKMGCVSLPLFTLFGPEALLHRLRDSGARAVVTNAAAPVLFSTSSKAAISSSTNVVFHLFSPAFIVSVNTLPDFCKSTSAIFLSQF